MTSILRLRPRTPHSTRLIWLAICSLGFVSLTITFLWFFQYQPALAAAPGYKQQFVTKPANLLDSVMKTAQIWYEQRPCEYKLVGWSDDNQLYYQAICGTKTESWQYTPDKSNKLKQVSAIPNELHHVTLSESMAREMVRADGVRPREYESVTRPLLLKSKGYVSLDGRWAAIITQHIYGPQDILVLTPSD